MSAYPLHFKIEDGKIRVDEFAEYPYSKKEYEASLSVFRQKIKEAGCDPNLEVKFVSF